MNKPLDPHVLRPDAFGHLTAEAAELDLPPDDIAQSPTRLYLSGIQALVHLSILQRLRDQAAGLNTAGFISGYRGSPLGVFDEALWKAKKLLDEHHVRFEPGINEDLGATMVWGTQQVNLFPRALRRRLRDVVRQVPRRRPHHGRVQARQRRGHVAPWGRPGDSRGRPWLQAVHLAASKRADVRGGHDARVDPLRRAGLPGSRHPRLGPVPLFRLLGGPKGDRRYGRKLRMRVRGPQPRRRAPARGF